MADAVQAELGEREGEDRDEQQRGHGDPGAPLQAPPGCTREALRLHIALPVYQSARAAGFELQRRRAKWSIQERSVGSGRTCVNGR